MAKWDYAECKDVIDRMVLRCTGTGKLWDVCKAREQHYYQTAEADPPMITGYESHARQSSILRDTHIKYRARMTENEARAQFSPARESAARKQKASDAEACFIQGMSEHRSNTGIDLQGFLADGQGMYCYGILHAYLDDRAINAKSAKVDYDERDDLSEYDDADDDDEDTRKGKAKERARYEEKDGKYRETDASLMARRNRARVGWPWRFSVPRPHQFAFVRDRKLTGEFKYALTVEVIPKVDFMEARDQLGIDDLTEQGAPIDVGEGGVTDDWRPSGQTSEKMVTLYRLWSREWIYEIAEGVDEKHRYRCVRNRVKMVPFWLAPGMVTNSDDPVFAYEPILASVYRFKPIYDRYISNMEALAESSAIARFWLVPMSDNPLPPLTDDEGHIKVFSSNAAEAVKPPDGYRYERIGGDGASAQYERLGEWFRAELQSVLPDTGVGDIKDSTEPWTAQILQRIGNIVPGMGIDHLANAYLGCFRMMVDVMADEEDGPGDIAFYPLDDESLVVMKPEDWRALNVEVEIDKISSVERATKQQIAMEFFNAQLWTELDVIEKGEGEPDPQRVLVARRVQRYIEQQVLDMLIKSKVAEYGGSKFSMQPVTKPGDTPFVDGLGRGVMPAEVLQANGVTPMPQPGMNGHPQIAQIPGQTMGPMPPLNVPGQAIMPGGM